MKGREAKAPPSADLLVCFPSRAHLSLMPKPICSPVRPSEPSTRHHRRPSHLRKGGGRGSPMLWAKSRHNSSADISEPTSPKVTCAGQIKVRTKPRSCKNWQSVMEEIERRHNKSKKRPAWIEALGFKKDVMQFLQCLRSIRFDFRCFGAVPSTAITSDEEEEEGEDVNAYRENSRMSKGDDDRDDQGSRAVFSKWFMILQEDNLSREMVEAEESRRIKLIRPSCDNEELCQQPPPNALLLMRCRSAPAKSWPEEREEEEAKKDDNLSALLSEIGKENGVVDVIQDKNSRSRSCKR